MNLVFDHRMGWVRIRSSIFDVWGEKKKNLIIASEERGAN